MSWLEPGHEDRALVEQTRASSPDLYALARRLAPALRVEPLLLRNARLRFLPRSTADLEPELWFGPLVRTGSARGIVLRPGVARLLVEDLATRGLLEETLECIAEQTRHWSVEERLEQELRLAARLDDPGPAREVLRQALRQVAVSAAPEARRELARWAGGAVAEFTPERPASAEAGWLAQFAAASVGDAAGALAARVPAHSVLPAELHAESATENTRLSVALGEDETARVLEFDRATPDAPAVDVGGPLPAQVTIQCEDESLPAPGCVAVWPGARVALPSGCGAAVLITAEGRRYRISPTPRAPAESEEAAGARPGGGAARAGALAALAEHLPAQRARALLEQALEGAGEGDEQVLRVIVAAARHLPSFLQSGLARVALRLAGRLEDPAARARTLAATLALLPEEEREAVAARALTDARQVSDEALRADLLLDLLDEQSLETHAEKLAQEIDHSLGSIPDAEHRADLRLRLLPHLPPHLRPEVLEHLFRDVDGVQERPRRAELLARLLPHLPEEQAAGVRDEVLSLAFATEDPAQRADVLCQVAPHLGADLRPKVVEEALSAATTLPDPAARGHLLLRLLPHLPHERQSAIVDEVLRAAVALDDREQRAHLVSAVAPFLTETERAKLVEQELADLGAAPQFSDSVDSTAAAGAEPAEPMTTRLAGSVGEGGENRREDVAAIQRLLNAVLEAGSPLIIDGMAGPATVQRIRQFQKGFPGDADGRIDPDGPSLGRLVTAAMIRRVDRPTAPAKRAGPIKTALRRIGGRSRPPESFSERVEETRRLLAEVDDAATAPERRLSIGERLADLGDPRPGVGLTPDGLPDIDWVEIPAGSFRYGEQQEPRELPAFRMARHPITNAQYQAFIDAGGYEEDRWWQGLAERIKAPKDPRWPEPNRPRTNVSWYETMAFCRWLTEVLEIEGEVIRLPTEQEWEKAARGTDGREYPWGEGYRAGFANIDEKGANAGPSDLAQTTAVGLYPQGASPYGLLDMAGNVWEWSLTPDEQPNSTETNSDALRVLRGGSWSHYPDYARCACRGRFYPGSRDDGGGFRVLCGPPISS